MVGFKWNYSTQGRLVCNVFTYLLLGGLRLVCLFVLLLLSKRYKHLLLPLTCGSHSKRLHSYRSV